METGSTLKEYQPLPYRLGPREAFLLYYSNDFDGMEVDRNQAVLSFASLEQIRKFLGNKHLLGEKELWDLDPVREWLRTSGDIPCPALYYSWNLFGDLARSLGEEFEGYGEDAQPVHEELFWGCNFPGMGSYTPSFTDSDRRLLREVLSQGMRWMETRVRPVP